MVRHRRPHNISYLAVSTSGDPTNLWRGVILPLPTVDPGLTTGVDAHGLYVCAANGNADSQQALDCLVSLLIDLHRPFRSRSALDMPAVLGQQGRHGMVYGVGGVQVVNCGIAHLAPCCQWHVSEQKDSLKK